MMLSRDVLLRHARRLVVAMPSATRGMTTRYKFDKGDKEKQQASRTKYFLLVFPVSTFMLGVWQTKRRTWKLGLIDELEQMQKSDPVPLPAGIEEGEGQFHKVIVSGKFDYTKQAYIGPRSPVQDETTSQLMSGGTRRRIGYYIVTPFEMDGVVGGEKRDREASRPLSFTKRVPLLQYRLCNSIDRILVNRGWIPSDKQFDDSGRPEGTIDLLGIIRTSDPPQAFVAKTKNDGKMNWTCRDIDSMSQALATSKIYLDACVDLNSNEGGPLAGQTRVKLRNEHLQYMGVWFSLSALSSFMWLKYFRFI